MVGEEVCLGVEDVVAQFAIELCADVLCRAALRTADDGHDAHGDDDGEEAGDDAVHDDVEVLVGGEAAVEGVVGALHVEVEQVGLGDDEVEVLVVDLGEVLCGGRGNGLGAKVLEQGPGDAGEEIDVGGAVEAASEVGGHGGEILGRRLDEVDDGHLVGAVSGRRGAGVGGGQRQRAPTSGIT